MQTNRFGPHTSTSSSYVFVINIVISHFPSFCFVHHVGFVDIELSRIVHKSISTNSIRIDPIGHCNVCSRCLSFFLFISNIHSNLDHIDVFKSLKNVYQNLSLKSSTCMYFFLLFFLHKFVWECLSIKYQCRFLCFKRRLFLSDIYRRCLNFICFDADKCWSFSENCWDWFINKNLSSVYVLAYFHVLWYFNRTNLHFIQSFILCYN